jgi:hypothetical protein
VVADFIMRAKNSGTAVGLGSGTAAVLIVAYALGITDLPSIPHGLIFGRFLHPEGFFVADFGILLPPGGDKAMLMLNNVFADATPRQRQRHANLVTPGEQTLVKPMVDDVVLHVLARLLHSSGDETARCVTLAPSGVDLARTEPGAGFVQLKRVVRDTWLFAGVVPCTPGALSVPAGSVLCAGTRGTRPGNPGSCGLCLAAGRTPGLPACPGSSNPLVPQEEKPLTDIPEATRCLGQSLRPGETDTSTAVGSHGSADDAGGVDARAEMPTVR